MKVDYELTPDETKEAIATEFQKEKHHYDFATIEAGQALQHFINHYPRRVYNAISVATVAKVLRLQQTDKRLLLMKKALMVIDGSLLIDEPKGKRLTFIYRMAHVGNGECEHESWEKELEEVYQGLIKDNIISPIESLFHEVKK